MSAIRWQDTRVAPNATHHVVNGRPLYAVRFREVLKFHAPGLAPVMDASGAYHITVTGTAAYAARYVRTFGYYDDLAAVRSGAGWFHIRPDGSPLYDARYAWCGNYQSGRCPVRTQDGQYLHLDALGAPAYGERYAYAGDYRDGIAVVQGDDGCHSHIDCQGHLVHGRWFEDLDVFHKGLAQARDKDGWYHINIRGEPVYARRFTAVEPFYNGQARVETEDGALQVIAEDGTRLHTLRPERRTVLHRLSGEMVGYWRTQTLRAAVKLGVLDALPGATDEIAAKIGVVEDSARRLLRALWEIRVVGLRSDGCWRTTERGRWLLPADEGMAAAARMWGGVHYTAWQSLSERLGSERSESGLSFFDHLQGAELRDYHRALETYARHDYASLPDAVNWTSHRVVLDAGGGTGSLLCELLTRFPHLRGVLLDRPEVTALAEFPGVIADRADRSPGDLLGPWPVSADAVVLARVLHDWDDAQALRLLSRACESLQADGAIYVVEMVLDEADPRGALADLNLLVMTGGRERTRRQWERLFGEIGLSLRKERSLNAVVSVMELRPR